MVNESERKATPEYTLVHGKKVNFHNRYISPYEALLWKWSRFLTKNKSRYCCFCEFIFPKASSEQECREHIITCKLENIAIADICSGEGASLGKK